MAIARGIDPDPLRDRLRSTWGRPTVEARDELRELAASIDARAQHPATLVCLVQTLRQSELPDSARRILRDAQFAYPGDFWFNSTLAYELSAQGDFEGALRYYTAAASLRPYSAVAYFNVGVTSRQNDKIDEAIAAYRKALELDPSNFAAQVNFASSLATQGKIDEAITAYRKVTETHPESFQAQYFLGSYLRDHGKQDEANIAFDRAIDIARQVIEQEPTSEKYVVLGDVLIAKGKFDDAVAAYRNAIELDPKNSSAYGHLANRVLRTRWNRDEAIAAYRKAISADPTKSGEFRRLLGKALQEWGMFDEAVSVFQEATEVDPKDARPYHMLGLCLATRENEMKPSPPSKSPLNSLRMPAFISTWAKP